MAENEDNDAIVATIEARWPEVQASIASEDARLGRSLAQSRPALISRRGILIIDVKYLNNCDFANTRRETIAQHVAKITGYTYSVACDWPMGS